jgi:hypothetical protein
VSRDFIINRLGRPRHEKCRRAFATPRRQKDISNDDGYNRARAKAWIESRIHRPNPVRAARRKRDIKTSQ